MAADTKRGAGLDCGDSGCRYATERGGMRTNGGCRCDLCPLCEKGIRFGHREWCQFETRARHVLAAQGLAVVTKAEADELAALRGRVKRAVEAYDTASELESTHMPDSLHGALEALRGR